MSAGHKDTISKVKKQMVAPITMLFNFLQSRKPICVWLVDRPDVRLVGTIIGFDEYMSVVLDNTAEVSSKKNSRRDVGRILLKGDNITMIHELPTPVEA